MAWPFLKIASQESELKSPSTYRGLARELALICQSVEGETYADRSWLPDQLQGFDPTWVVFYPDRAIFGLGGGFYHYGYTLELDEAASTPTTSSWTLSFYSEGSETPLETATLDRKDSLSPKDLAARIIKNYGGYVRSHPTSLAVHKRRILYLVRANLMDEARSACMECITHLPATAWPRLTLARIDARSLGVEEAGKRFSEWARETPSFHAYFHLFHFYAQEGSVDKASDSLSELLRQPAEDHTGDSFNVHYLGTLAAFYALENKRYDLARELCHKLRRGGSPTSRGAFRLRFLVMESASCFLGGDQDAALSLLKEIEAARSQRAAHSDPLPAKYQEFRKAVLAADQKAVVQELRLMVRPDSANEIEFRPHKGAFDSLR